MAAGRPLPSPEPEPLPMNPFRTRTKEPEMSPKNRTFLIGAIVAVVVILCLFGSAVSWYNDAVSLEESVKAQWTDNQNRYDAFWKTVKETAQVPEKYKDDFKDLLVAETKAKYGEGGSQAPVQWFQDRKIDFDASQYRRIQDVIESGRNDFKRSQTDLRDKQRKYAVHVRGFFGRMWASWYSMPKEVGGELAPKKDLDGDGRLTVLDYPIVTSGRTKAAFENGSDEPVQVFTK